MALWPASFWIDPGQTRVDDFYQGTDFELISTSDPLRDFNGSYTVIIRDALTNQVVEEDPSGIFPYKKDAERPDPLLISWRAPRLPTLEHGSYYMVTCWTVHQAFYGIVPKKTDCSASNIFRVLPTKE